MILDVIVVLLYAASMLLMGWYGMRRAKTSDDFLVAGRNLGPALYMGTMAAVVLGGASTTCMVSPDSGCAQCSASALSRCMFLSQSLFSN
jgi:Na+/proline symporter